MSTQLLSSVTHTSSVTADQIDELGHMNVRWYGHNAIAATMELATRLGLAEPTVLSSYTRHHHEQLEGSELEVRSAVLHGGDRLRFFHELRNRADDDLAATFIHELDQPGLSTPTVPVPEYGRARSLALDTNRLATAPPLAELR